MQIHTCLRRFNFESILFNFENLPHAKHGENFEILLRAKRGENWEILLRAKRGGNLEILLRLAWPIFLLHTAGLGQNFFYIRLTSAMARADFFLIYGWPRPGPAFFLYTSGQGQLFKKYTASQGTGQGHFLVLHTAGQGQKFFYIR